MCSITIAHTLHDAYNLTRCQEHRGRDMVGISGVGDDIIDTVKLKGTTHGFSKVALQEILRGEKYHTYVSHSRYKTRGRQGSVLEEGHPHVIGGIWDDRGSHIIIHDSDAIIIQNGQTDEDYIRNVDRSKLKTECDSEAFMYEIMDKGVDYVVKNYSGFGVVALAQKKYSKEGVIVMRDKTGIKPAYIGKKDGKNYVVSESVAYLENGGECIDDMLPGSVIYLLPSGSLEERIICEPNRSECFFEWNYIGHENSNINALEVRALRDKLGFQLAKEFNPTDAEVVTFAPSCPGVAARRYARETGKEFVKMFYKMRGERSFMGSTKEDRKKSIQSNLYLIPEIEKKIGKRGVVVIDDSIVRGNVVSRVNDLLDLTNVTKKYMASYTPPIGIYGSDGIGRGCNWGVDMPSVETNDHNFFSRNGLQDKFEKETGMNIYFMSIKGMLEVFRSLGKNPNDLCTYCIGGKHPYREKIVQLEVNRV